MGFKVGPYMVTDTLGVGAFGKVKLAQHQESGLEYAIKIMDKNSITENELTVNVRREIAIMRALNHRNIVNLRNVLSSRSKLYLVMDLVKGGELFDEIERRGELGTKTARKYFQELVDGIDYCHQRGVFHRDLKPENLLVDETGTLKITDFGVSSMKVDAQKGNDLLFTACGTPYYCAPEIINGAEGGYSGVKIDAWSCGIILYLLLTGNLPFQSEDMGTLYEQINKCKVFYPHWMEKDAKDLISNLLKKDPDARYSLEDVYKHPWFLVDYEHHEPERSDNNSSGSLVRKRSKNGRNSSSSSKDGRRSSSKGSKRSGQKVGGSSDSLQGSNPVDIKNLSASSRPPLEPMELPLRLPPLQYAEAANTLSKNHAELSVEVPPRLPPMQYTEPENTLQKKDVEISSSESVPRPPIRAQSAEPAKPPMEEHKEALPSSSEVISSLPSNPTKPEKAESTPIALTEEKNVDKRSDSEKPASRVVRDISEYDDDELSVLIQAALPGKPTKRIEKVVSQLEELDIDCAEDLAFLASTLGTPAAATSWLEEKTKLTSFTAMRVAQFLFS